jgi:phosphopantetheine--protein transferase-like protein|tara:strand:- start:1209 stop:1535 length:327 start_codon:yes stop_codon:yes gene_type:complete
MKVRVGCDIVNVNRFNSLDEKTLNKIFHPRELKSRKPETLAGIFAVKESCKKVFNDLNWHDIEIIKKRNGKPIISLNINQEIINHDVSISHDGDYAMATVVFLMEKGV